MKYAGITDGPEKIKRQRNNPSDFKIMQQFTSEAAARQWKVRMMGQGYEEDAVSQGWKYGYTFSLR